MNEPRELTPAELRAELRLRILGHPITLTDGREVLISKVLDVDNDHLRPRWARVQATNHRVYEVFPSGTVTTAGEAGRAGTCRALTLERPDLDTG